MVIRSCHHKITVKKTKQAESLNPRQLGSPVFQVLHPFPSSPSMHIPAKPSSFKLTVPCITLQWPFQLVPGLGSHDLD